MKEYRIVCDQVRTDTKGRSWTTFEQYPIGLHGNALMSVFHKKADAEIVLKQWKLFGKEFERNCEEDNKRYPSICTTIIHQLNYRVQSREVTNWE